jgi:hypothetical protein
LELGKEAAVARSKWDLQQSAGLGEDAATTLGAWIGWVALALPAAALFFATPRQWGGPCNPTETLTFLIMSNIIAVILLGVWISRLRLARDNRQARLNNMEQWLGHALNKLSIPEANRIWQEAHRQPN